MPRSRLLPLTLALTLALLAVSSLLWAGQAAAAAGQPTATPLRLFTPATTGTTPSEPPVSAAISPRPGSLAAERGLSALLTPPLPGAADAALCLTTQRAWGVGPAGGTLTVTVDGAQMGAALADGSGFYWTTLLNAAGDRPDLAAGSEVAVYADGAPLIPATPLRAIAGTVDVLNDVVAGSIGGVTSPMSVTVYAATAEPSALAYSQTVSTDAGGAFSADFTGQFNFLAWDEALVAYVENGLEVHRHVYPTATLLVRPWPFDQVIGRAAPGASLSATVYLSDGVSVKEALPVATGSDGLFVTGLTLGLEAGDLVVADFGGGVTLTRTVEMLTMAAIDTAADDVTGEAAPGAVVVGMAQDLTPDGWRVVLAETTAAPSGAYTLTFGGRADLLPAKQVWVFVPDAEGDELGLRMGAPGVEVNQTGDSVTGFAAAPTGPLAEGWPVTLTVYSAAGDSTQTFTQGLGWGGAFDFNPGNTALPDLAPGDSLTVEAEGYAWQGVVPLTEITVTPDLAANTFSGTITPPSDRVELALWMPNSNLWPLNGTFETLSTDGSPFAFTLSGDVVNNLNYDVGHRTSDQHVERISRETGGFGAWLPGNVVLASLREPGVAFTITLMDGGGAFKAQHTGVSTGASGFSGWNDFWADGVQVLAGDRARLESATGFSQTMDIPLLTIGLSPDRTRLVGQGPANTLLYATADGQGEGFVPTGPDGTFTVALDQLQAFFGTGTAEWGQGLSIRALDANGNWAATNFNWPVIVAETQQDGRQAVTGWNAIAGQPVVITVTHPVSGELATGSAMPGACDGCGPQDYRFDLPDGTLTPGMTVTADFGGGLIDTVEVVALAATADPDTDVVAGLAPPDAGLRLNADCWYGGCWSEFNDLLADGLGAFGVDLGGGGFDIQPGDTFNLYYNAPRGHQVSYRFWLPVTDLALEKYVLGGGQARPGGVVVYALYYANWGNGVTTDTVLVETLPPLTTLAGDTSGLPVVEAGGVVTWTIGALAPGEEHSFVVTLNVDQAASGEVADNCATLSSSLPEISPGNETACAGTVAVAEGEVGGNVDKWATPGDPHPGERFDYQLRVCSSRGTAYGPVWLTDTLPLSTTLISWQPTNWREPVWVELSRADGQLALWAPGLPGNYCADLWLTLELDPAVPLGTRLHNTLVFRTLDDIDPENNQVVNTYAWVGPARSDLQLDHWLENGALVPGGWAQLGANYANQGNLATTGRLTVTLPAGAAYQPNSGRDAANQAFDPVSVTPDEIVWDLGLLPVNGRDRVSYVLDLDGGLTPGAELGVCAAIAPPLPDATPPDNTGCATVGVRDHGPNLVVTKQHQWYGSNRLHYEITFGNWGDAAVLPVTVTDTYPAEVTLSSGLGWDFWQGITWHDTGTELIFEIEELQPGWQARAWFDVDLNDPNARPRWYTNTVEITPPDGETYPADNTAVDAAVKPEVDRVEFYVDTDHSRAWGQAQPGATVTVTTAYTEVTTTADPNCDGCWNLNDLGPVYAGETVTVTAGDGTQPVISLLPTPFTAQVDTGAGTVSGQIGALDTARLEVNLSGGPGRAAWTDGAGHYSAAFGLLPRDVSGEVRYATAQGDTQVILHRSFRSDELILRVNYAHDWIEGFYPVGPTIALTVTDGGGAVKGTALLTTLAVPWWNGETGFTTSYDGWNGDQPDLQPGDWVHAAASNGYTTSVRIGTVNGSLDVDADSVSGTVSVPWLGGWLEARCAVWENGGPGSDFLVAAAGGGYACDFSDGWDLQPGQDVGVSYYDPSRNEVINVLVEPTPHLQVQKWAEGQPGEGGALLFWVQVRNQGDAAAEGVVVTDTFDGFSYLYDLSGWAALTSTVPSGEEVVWSVGTLPANTTVQFELYAQVTAVADAEVHNTLDITTANAYDQGDPSEKHAEWSGLVAPVDTQLTVDMNVWTWDPLPGGEYVYAVNVCNKGGTSSSPVTLTDTLPLSTTLVSWWGQHTGWSEVASAPDQLVLTRGTATSYWCGEVYVRVQVDAAAEGGQALANTATVFAANDQTAGDDTITLNHTVGGSARPNLRLDKSWGSGQLTPGEEMYYNLGLRNDGNVPMTGVRVTDTLPAGASFVTAWRNTPTGQETVTPTLVTEAVVVWELGQLDNGYGDNLNVELEIDELTEPGALLENCATSAAGARETDPYDNTSCVSEQVQAAGPNLRVVKLGEWRGPNQLHYLVRLENVGTTIVYGVALTDTLPAGTTLQGWNLNVPPGWGAWSAQESGGVITGTLERLEPGWTTWLDIYVDVPGVDAGTRFTNTAEITLPPGDVNPADNTAEHVAVSGPNLTLTKTHTGGPAHAAAGDLITYTLHFANNTAWGFSGPVWLTDTLPAGLTFVSAQQSYCGAFDCDRGPEATTPLPDGRTALAWNWGGWGGGWIDLIVTAQVAEGLPDGAALANTAEIGSFEPAEGEYDLTDNSAAATVWALNPAFTTGKTVTGSRVAGTVVTYTLTVTNTGGLTGTAVLLRDALPAGLTYGGGSGFETGGLINWTLPSIAPNGGTSTAWFTGTLACTLNTLITNDQYSVIDSGEGITSAAGLPVSFSSITPTVSLTLDRAPAPVVISGSVAFTATASTNGPPLTYAWDFGDGATAAGGLTRSHTYTEVGGYTATITATDGCGWEVVQTAAVTVTAPAISAGFNTAPAPAEVLVGGTVAFTDTSTTNGPPLTAWLWQFGDGAVSAAQHPTHTYSLPGVYTVTLTVTDTLGYSDSEVKPALVTVSTGCVACTGLDFDISPGAPLVGRPVTFTAHLTPANTSGPVTFVWRFGDGATVTTTAATVTHTYLSWGPFTVEVTASNAGTPSGVSRSRQIVVAAYTVRLPIIIKP